MKGITSLSFSIVKDTDIIEYYENSAARKILEPALRGRATAVEAKRLQRIIEDRGPISYSKLLARDHIAEQVGIRGSLTKYNVVILIFNFILRKLIIYANFHKTEYIF